MAVQALLGNIFDGGTDLTVLPCSSKPSVSNITRNWIDAFGLQDPLTFDYDLEFGGISKVYEFTHSTKRTKYYTYGAAVLNDYSKAEKVFKIASAIGQLTRDRDDIRNVECVLLGTGAGGLPNTVSIVSLAAGFEDTAHPEARMIVYSPNAQVKNEIEKELGLSNAERVAEKIKLSPSVFGIGVDLNETKMKVARAINKIRFR